jgi:hypothetical protein
LGRRGFEEFGRVRMPACRQAGLKLFKGLNVVLVYVVYVVHVVWVFMQKRLSPALYHYQDLKDFKDFRNLHPIDTFLLKAPYPSAQRGNARVCF